ncbi:MAG: hypothetical protein MO852_15955, partial [Candidatus Devosia euplotis]|nr:hypothetical protein [Candidatus Devosia euplotis]
LCMRTIVSETYYEVGDAHEGALFRTLDGGACEAFEWPDPVFRVGAESVPAFAEVREQRSGEGALKIRGRVDSAGAPLEVPWQFLDDEGIECEVQPLTAGGNRCIPGVATQDPARLLFVADTCDSGPMIARFSCPGDPPLSHVVEYRQDALCDPPQLGPVRAVGEAFTGDTHHEFVGDTCTPFERDADFAPALQLSEPVDPTTFPAVPLRVDD